jgi:hypothetical protein
MNFSVLNKDRMVRLNRETQAAEAKFFRTQKAAVNAKPVQSFPVSDFQAVTAFLRSLTAVPRRTGLV